MSDRIILTGISAIGYHGVYPEERREGQKFIVDATLDVDLSIAGSNDHLINTVDYSKVALLIHAIIIGEPFALIERLAEEVALQILEHYSLIKKVIITVHKPDAPVGIEISDIAVQIESSMKVVIALGSNLGDREGHLNAAIEELSAAIRIVAVSSFLNTDPVGGVEQPDFLNAVLIGECTHTPEELLQLLLQIEARQDRVRDVRWGPRTLDLDLIIADDVVVESEGLQLPHPRAHERAFVLAPWLEIDPDAHIPGHGRVDQLLGELSL